MRSSVLLASLLGLMLAVFPATSQAGGSSMSWKVIPTSAIVEPGTMTNGFMEFEMENYFPDQRDILLDSVSVSCTISGLPSTTLITQSAQISAPWMTTVEKKLTGSKKTKSTTFSLKKKITAGDTVAFTIDMGIHKQAVLEDMTDCFVRNVKVRDAKTGQVLYSGAGTKGYMYVESTGKGQLVVSEIEQE